MGEVPRLLFSSPARFFEDVIATLNTVKGKQSPSDTEIASSPSALLATLAPHASAASYSEFVKGLPARK